MKTKPVQLDDWSVTKNIGPYDPPELAVPCLHGKVKNHPKHPDGEEVTTSRIVGVEGSCIKTYSGSVYTLKRVNRNYAKMFPNARKRLIETWRAK